MTVESFSHETQPSEVKPNAKIALPIRMTDIASEILPESDLSQVPVYGSKRDISPTTTRYVAVINRQLIGQRFLSFLGDTAPNDYSDLGGTVADWKMPDFKGKNALKDYYQRLQKLHATLGLPWGLFELNREMFMRVIQANDDAPSVLSINISNGYDDDVQKFRAEGGRASRYHLERLFSNPEMYDFKKGLSNFIKALPHESKKKKRQSASPDSIIGNFTMWSPKNRQTAFNRYFDGLPSEDQERFIKFYGREMRRIVHPKELTLVEPEQVDGEEGIVSIDKSNCSFIAKQTDGNVFSVIPESIRYRQFLLPTIVWDKNEDGRMLQATHLEQADLSTDFMQQVLDRQRIRGGWIDPRRLNPVVGVLAVAHFSPTLRGNEEIWPKTMGIEGAGYKQNLRAAQVPVLALMRLRELSQTSILQNLEQHIDATAA